MHCPSCGVENRSERRFCRDCGTALARACASCGTPDRDGGRFCGECGAALSDEPARPAHAAPERAPRDYTPGHLADRILSSRSALEGERKQVTVLFCDVKGSMELAEQVDAEEWHRILDRFFEILAEGVHRFEGTVNQYTGDGVMALFGAPIAHEDHAQRACFAVLWLRDRVREYADTLRTERGLNFGVRFGLNSGEVVVGKIGDDLRMDYTARGHTVGIAARMEQLAESGSACLTGETARLVEGLFRLRDLGPTRVKGASGPVHVYELEGPSELQTRLEVSRLRGLSRFVGRGDELAVLESALDAALNGRARVVGVVGEPGAGKSRLCLELAERARARGLDVFEARCPSHGRSVPWLPLTQLLRACFGIDSTTPNAEARTRVAGTLVLLDDTFRDTLPRWFELLGVAERVGDTTATDRSEGSEGIGDLVERFFRLRSRESPSVLLWDDLHWIDPGSDAVLGRLIQSLAGTPTLVVANFRPEYRADWMTGGSYRELALGALGPDVIESLLREQLGADPTVAPLPVRLRERAAGNPFFAEEIVRSLVASGHLEGTRGAYRLARRLESLDVPATLQALITSRIDRLGDEAKRTLQAAAVLGKEVGVGLLEGVLEAAAGALAAPLDVLERAALLDRIALYPEPVYSFRHPLTQEVAYRSQLVEARRELHARAAAALEESPGGGDGQRAALLAHHLEHAGRLLDAARAHAEAALGIGFVDVRAALFHWRETLRLAGDVEAPDVARLRLDACLGALGVGGRADLGPDESRELFDLGSRLAERLGEISALARLHTDFAARLGWSGDPSAQRRHLGEATRLLEQSGDLGVRARTLRRRAIGEFHAGDLRSALELDRQAIAAAEALEASGQGSLELRAARLDEAVTLAFQGCLAESEARLEQVERSSAHLPEGDIRSRHTTALVRAQLAHHRGDASLAERFAEDFVALAERTGSTWARVVSGATLGRAHILAGHFEAACAALETSLELARRTRIGLDTEAAHLAALAEAYTGSGRLEDAERIASEARALARRRETRFQELLCDFAYARVLLARNDAGQADTIARALDHAEQLVDETGGEIARPALHELRSGLATLYADPASRDRERAEARRLYAALGASGHSARLAS